MLQAADADAAAQMRWRQFAALLEHSPQAIVILDAEGRIREWNPAAQNLLGWSRAEILGGLLHRLIPPDGAADFERIWTTLTKGGSEPPYQSVHLHRDGTRVPVRVNVAAIQEGDGQFAGVVSTLSHLGSTITQSGRDRQMPEQVISVLECDDLTVLPGRRWLQRRLAESVPEGMGRGVGVLDVDAFALVNQGYGPDAADDVLCELAERLQNLAGSAVLGRWQADEFVCIVDAHDPAAALDELVGRLAAATREAFQVGDEQVRLTMSGGLARTPVVPGAGLLRSATAALDAAKAGGRDRAVWFDPAAHQLSSVGGLRLSNDLHRGIADGELRLHFQPIVALATNDVVGVEALVRWERPGVGLLAPGSFIDVAERTGEIVALGAWVARHACLAAVELAQGAAAPRTVSINISARQLSDPGLVEMLSDALTGTGCPPSNIIVEVTETALLNDIGAATSVLEAIKALGVDLDLDDFGTGYSSLLYLKHFPVDRIKIDQSFVNGLGIDAADTAIVASTIALAHSVGLSAVAEGVETADQLALLRQMGCDFAQGYLLSRPLPLAELQTWLAQHVPSVLLPREAHGGGSGATVALDRDKIADRRDQVGDQRDQVGDRRDRAADRRDQVGDRRDQVADRRDQDADRRDQAADRSTTRQRPEANPDGLGFLTLAMQEAATDRSRARQDRGIGAGKRMEAAHDRNRALAHRGAGADKRLHAGRDRDRATVNRAASAKEREFASVDALTGGYLRDAGFAALQDEIEKAQRTGQSLVVGCVDVNDLPAINARLGHTGGDSVLVGVANALTATLRSTDVIIRSGPGRFVCAFPRLRAVTVAKRLAVIQLALAGPPTLGTVTVGVAQLQSGDSLEQLMERADAALGQGVRKSQSAVSS